MCCHCQVRQHALHCDSQPIIPDDFMIALCVPFLHPYLVSGIREDWRGFPLRAGDVLSPCPKSQGERRNQHDLGRVGMKGVSLSFYEIPPPAQRQAGKLREQTKESENFVRYRQATTRADISK